MAAKIAKADITPIRQRSQFSCMAASMSMALKCHGQGHCDEDTVNKVMGARPMQGASWEQALACAQHFGMRGTLTSPCTLKQLKAWTDAGTPVLIAWNPEGREWSHASVVFDVDEDENVHVADPNIPDPDETVRIVPKSEFYAKWYEKWSNYLVRRPAMAIEREITSDGRQVMASSMRDLLKREAGSFDQPLRTRRDYGATASMKTSEYAAVLKYAVNLPADVERYVEDIKKKNPDYSEGQAWATAWSIYCKYKNPESDHCKMNASDYFQGRKAAGPYEIMYRVPGKGGFKTKGFKDESSAQKWVEKFIEKEGGDVEIRWPSKTAKFPAGKSMTVDEVADVVGPEFKEMNEDPPDSVQKLKDEMKKKAHRPLLLAMDAFAEMLRDGKFEKGKPADPTENMSEEDAAEWERQNEEHRDEFKDASTMSGIMYPEDSAAAHHDHFFGRTAAAKLVWKVNRVMGAQYAETPVGTYWIYPDGRNYEIRLDNTPVGFAGQDQYAEDPSADAKKMVEAHYAKALRGKTAAVTAGGKWGFTKSTESACTAGVGKLQKAASRIAKALYAKDEGSVAFLQKHSAKAGSKTASMLLKAMEDIGPAAALLKKGKTAGKSGNGLYGFSEKTAKLGLDACSALHHEAGVIAADLFARKGADPVKVAGYLAANAKKGKCAFSAMLAEVAPDVAVEVTGTVKKKATDFLASDESDDEVADIISKC